MIFGVVQECRRELNGVISELGCALDKGCNETYLFFLESRWHGWIQVSILPISWVLVS